MFFRADTVLVFTDSNNDIFEDILICSRSLITSLDNPRISEISYQVYNKTPLVWVEKNKVERGHMRIS